MIAFGVGCGMRVVIVSIGTRASDPEPNPHLGSSYHPGMRWQYEDPISTIYGIVEKCVDKVNPVF